MKSIKTYFLFVLLLGLGCFSQVEVISASDPLQEAIDYEEQWGKDFDRMNGTGDVDSGGIRSTIGGFLQGVGTVIEDAATGGPSEVDKCSEGMPGELKDGCQPVFSGEGLDGGLLFAGGQIHGVYKERSLIKLIAGWIRFILPIIAFLAFIALLIAGWFFVTSGGEDGQHEKAKKTIIWVSVGLIVVMGAYAIINTFLGGIT